MNELKVKGNLFVKGLGYTELFFIKLKRAVNFVVTNSGIII